MDHETEYVEASACLRVTLPTAEAEEKEKTE